MHFGHRFGDEFAKLFDSTLFNADFTRTIRRNCPNRNIPLASRSQPIVLFRTGNNSLAFDTKIKINSNVFAVLNECTLFGGN